MNDRLSTLLDQMKHLEDELIQETKKKGPEFCAQVHAKRVQFTEAARALHKQHHLGLPRYWLHSRFLVLITSPVIWVCLIPIVFTDVIGSLYQAICFPIYGIPKVRRRDYLAFDRHHLGYLNFVEKLSCEYCAYVNGILTYFTEIAARTEQHWCPIKHAGCVKCAHSRYKKFFDYGDAEKYRKNFEGVRRAYEDVASSEVAPKKS